MKPDFIDDINVEEIIKKEHEKQEELDSISDYFIIEKPKNPINANLKELLILADSIQGDKHYSQEIVNFIYLFNSKVNLTKFKYAGGEYKDEKKLLILPDAHVVINLYNPDNNSFIANIKDREMNTIEECINAILEKNNYGGYDFFSLKEAFEAEELLKRANYYRDCAISKEEKIVFNNSVIVNCKPLGIIPLWSKTLNILFHGEGNWVIGTSYFNMAKHLENKLLPFNVFCYESLSYLKEEDHGSFIIETEVPLNNTLTTFTNEEYAIFAKLPDAPCTLIFLGICKIDKKRSLIENHIAYKLFRRSITLDTYFMK